MTDQNHSRPNPAEAPIVLQIDRIITGGDGIARHGDGRVVFVPRTAPGERVEVGYTEEHRQWLRGRLLRVVEASPFRREPPCPYYHECGGCQLQHLNYDAQLSIKPAIVADSLRRLGRFEIDTPEIVPSPHEFGYRNRITLVLQRHGDEITVGYHAFDDPSRLVAVDRCPLAEQSINDVWSALPGLLDRIGASVPRDAEWRLTFRASSEGRVGLAIEGANRPGDIDRSVLEGLIEKGLVAVWMVNDEGWIIAHAGTETLGERWGSYEIPLAGTAFLQVNRDAAARLGTYVHEQCGVTAGARVVDAYCGFGLRAFELAQSGTSVVGIDSDRHAIRAASEIGVASGLSVRFIANRVERVLMQELPADTVILNPPRGGVANEVVDALLRRPPGRIVYVSCDPATLARDLKGLATGFALDAVKAYDLFPQTAHVETVVTLVRRSTELS
jgi:23S rRNA (uracil1939-C5)-methyltransferase